MPALFVESYLLLCGYPVIQGQDGLPPTTEGHPQGRVESIDFVRGTFSGWIELRNGQVPHLQLREGDISRTKTFTLGKIRRDVSSVKGIIATGFTVSAGQPISPYDVQSGVTAVHALWGLEDHALPTVADCRALTGRLVDLMPNDLKVPRGNFSHVNIPIGTRLGHGASKMSSFEIPVGTTSGDGVTIVGESGNLFLRGGGNSLEAQYAWGTPAGPAHSKELIEDYADAWQEVFQKRAQSLTERGVPFRQLVIPEKNSVLTHLMPLDVETPTPLYRHLVRAVANEGWFIDSLPLFRQWNESGAPSWMKVDSHFTTEAALALTKVLLTDLSLCDQKFFDSVRIGPDFEYLRGEMGWRLVGFDLYDKLSLPNESTLATFGPAVDPASVVEPASGGNVGTRISWVNELAPIDKHLLVFGNSFFGKGRKANQMSWWFSRLAKQFTMIWHPEVDMRVVDQLEPDVVICQTVERFLARVPKV